MFRNNTIKCLIEIASLDMPEYDAQFSQILGMTIECLSRFLPPDTSMADEHRNI
jgi:hypothetical protein